MIEIIENSSFLPVSLIEMRKHLRIEHDLFDGEIINHIKMATRLVERTINKGLLIKTYRYFWTEKIENYPFHYIKLPYAPISEIIEVQDVTMRSRLKRFCLERSEFLVVNCIYKSLSIIYKSGMATHPEDLNDDFKSLIYMVAGAMFEGKDLETHPCMKVLQCYKENSCTSV